MASICQYPWRRCPLVSSRSRRRACDTRAKGQRRCRGGMSSRCHNLCTSTAVVGRVVCVFSMRRTTLLLESGRCMILRWSLRRSGGATRTVSRNAALAMSSGTASGSEGEYHGKQSMTSMRGDSIFAQTSQWLVYARDARASRRRRALYTHIARLG